MIVEVLRELLRLPVICTATANALNFRVKFYVFNYWTKVYNITIRLYRIILVQPGGSVSNQHSKYQLLKSLEREPNLTQRHLSNKLGMSLGKVNYCLQSLIKKGFIKISNFKNSKHKIQYSYLLTPKGIEEKTKLTIKFFKAKTKEYEALKKEAEELMK